jgi:hypothetical protein
MALALGVNVSLAPGNILGAAAMIIVGSALFCETLASSGSCHSFCLGNTAKGSVCPPLGDEAGGAEPLSKTPWIVFAKRPFAGPSEILDRDHHRLGHPARRVQPEGIADSCMPRFMAPQWAQPWRRNPSGH